jgi:hypothetical protein
VSQDIRRDGIERYCRCKQPFARSPVGIVHMTKRQRLNGLPRTGAPSSVSALLRDHVEQKRSSSFRRTGMAFALMEHNIITERPVRYRVGA